MDRVTHAILATRRHSSDPLTGDAALVVDIDLSILGRDHSQFEVYELAIRREYEWVPLPIHRQKRSELLQSFLDRPTIYATNEFVRRFESRARENIRWAKRRLCDGRPTDPAG